MPPSLDQTLDHIAAAPFTPARWADAIDGIADAAGGWAGQLAAISPTRGYVLNLAPQSPSELLQDLEDWGVDTNVQPRAAITNAPLMQVVADYDLISPEARDCSPFYAFLQSFNVSFCCMAQIDRTDDLSIVVAATRHERAGHVDAAERDRFAALLPHLRSAVRLQLRLEDHAAVIATGLMEAVGLPVALCDRAGRVRAFSPRAEAVLRGGGAAVMRSGRLSATDTACDAALQAAIVRAAMDSRRLDRPQASRVRLRDPAGGATVFADVAPLPRHLYSFHLGAAVMVAFEVKPPSALDPVRTLRRAYGLSVGEAEVALALSQGLSLAEIGERRGVRVTTLRTQIAALLAKTHTARQAELVALVGRTLGR